MSSGKSESVFFCQGRVFLHSLELIPIYDNRVMELVNPSVEDLAPFVQSGFGCPHIDCLFSAHHWHHGDKLRYNDDHSCWYYLREIVWNNLTVRVPKINPTFGDTSAGGSNSGLDDVQLHLHWMQRAFEVGDNVEITFGMHKGKSIMLSELTAKTVTVLSTDLSHVSSIVIRC